MMSNRDYYELVKYRANITQAEGHYRDTFDGSNYARMCEEEVEIDGVPRVTCTR